MKFCPYCETKLGRYGKKVTEGHIDNCLARKWCTRCGWHKSVHSSDKHSRANIEAATKSGIVIGAVCARFVGKMPNRSLVCEAA